MFRADKHLPTIGTRERSYFRIPTGMFCHWRLWKAGSDYRVREWGNATVNSLLSCRCRYVVSSGAPADGLNLRRISSSSRSCCCCCCTFITAVRSGIKADALNIRWIRWSISSRYCCCCSCRCCICIFNTVILTCTKADDDKWVLLLLSVVIVIVVVVVVVVVVAVSVLLLPFLRYGDLLAKNRKFPLPLSH